MRGRKTLYIVTVFLTALGSFFIWKGYEKHAFKREGEKKVAALTASLTEMKGEMINAYDRRIMTLEKWAEAEKARVKTLPTSLELGAEIAEAKGMVFKTFNEAARYDFLQNQVREKVGEYLRFNQTEEKIQQMSEVEQDINRTRKEYHTLARQIISAEEKYNLPKSEPVMFPAEKNHDEGGFNVFQ